MTVTSFTITRSTHFHIPAFPLSRWFVRVEEAKQKKYVPLSKKKRNNEKKKKETEFFAGNGL